MKVNVDSWNCVLEQGWEIKILNFNSSSPNYLYNFLTSEELPIGFNIKMDKNHISDIVRLAILKKYGGVYIGLSNFIMLRHKCDFIEVN